MSERDIIRIVIRSVFIAAILGIVLWFAWEVRTVLVILVVALIMATGLSPVVDSVAGIRPKRRVLRLPRAVAVLLIYLGLVGLAALFITGIVPPIVREGNEFIRNLPNYLEDLNQTIHVLGESYPFLPPLEQSLVDQLRESIRTTGTSTQAQGVIRFALDVVQSVLYFLLVFVLTFYLIVDGTTIREGILKLVPPENRSLFNTLSERVRAKIASWLIGQVVLSTIIGVVTFIGLTVLGVPYALFLAGVAAIGELVPTIGPIASAVPAIIVASSQSPFLGLATLVFCIVVQQLENNVVVPQVMRQAVDLPPVGVMIALLMGGELLGVVGAVLALPVAASVSVIIAELVALRDRDREPEAPEKTETDAEPAQPQHEG